MNEQCHTICLFQQHYYCTIKILIIEAKEVARIGNNGFLFRIRTQGNYRFEYQHLI
jgi:hypothetical protein